MMIQSDQSQYEFVEVGPSQELGNGERWFIQIDDLNIIVFNIAGQVFAIGDICSHDNGELGDGELDGFEVICPRHGARFDIRTGEARALPAVVGIPVFPVRIVDGAIQVGLSKN